MPQVGENRHFYSLKFFPLIPGLDAKIFLHTCVNPVVNVGH